MTEHKLASRIWALLLTTYPNHNGLWKVVWDKLSLIANRKYSGLPVSINVHGCKTYLHYGHAYPLFARRFKNWNNPLLEIVFQIHKNVATPIIFVDIGAGIGDTVRLLQANCPGMVQHYHCIEGDDEFLAIYRPTSLHRQRFRYTRPCFHPKMGKFLA